MSVNVELKQKLKVAEELDELYIVTKKELFNEVREKLESLPNNVRLYTIDKFLEKLRNLSGEKSE